MRRTPAFCPCGGAAAVQMGKGGCHTAAAAAKSGARMHHTTRKATAERKAAYTIAPAAERRARAQRLAASIPIAERRRYKGVRRESKEGVGGTRNPPIPPWPPEAATWLLPQPTAAQECRPKNRNATEERKAALSPSATAAQGRYRYGCTAAEERRAAPPLPLAAKRRIISSALHHLQPAIPPPLTCIL